MNPFLSITEKSPFYGKLIIGDYKSQTLAALSEFFSSLTCDEPINKRTAILCEEKDYLLMGNALRGFLIENEIDAEAYVVSASLEEYKNVLGEYKIFIAAGDDAFIGKAQVLSAEISEKAIFVSTTLIFANAFTKRRFIDGLYYENCSDYKYILDIDHCKKLKRADLADAYSFVAANVLKESEFEINRALLGFSNDDSANNYIDALTSARKVLMKMTDVNIVGIITVAEFYLAKALDESNDILSDLDLAGFILSKMTGTPVSECVFGLTGTYLMMLKGYINTEPPILYIPTVNKDVEKLAEIIQVNEIDIYERFNLYQNDEIEEKRNLLNKIPDIEAKIDLQLVRYKKLQRIYGNVYKGRHNRKTFSKKEETLALKLAGLLSCGVLKLAYSDGYLSLINEI